MSEKGCAPRRNFFAVNLALKKAIGELLASEPAPKQEEKAADSGE